MKQIIKTTEPVEVSKLNAERDEKELKIVYATHNGVNINNDTYSPVIVEWVIDNIETTDVDGTPITVENKRIIFNKPKPKNKQEIYALIAFLKDDASLDGAGLPHLKGRIQTKDELEMLDFLLETAHLIYNNQDQVRGVTWEIHTETV